MLLMLLDNNQQLYHTFFEFYIGQGNILSKKDLQKQRCQTFFEFYICWDNILLKKSLLKKQSHTFLEFYIDEEQNSTQKTSFIYFITYFNYFYCEKISIGSFMNHFLSFIAFRNKLHCTENHILFFKTSWIDGLSKKIELEYDLSCVIGKDGIFFPENMILFLGRKVREVLFQEIHGNMKFSVYMYGCSKCGAIPLCQRNQRWSYLVKIHQKIIDHLDRHSRKSYSNSLYFHGDLYSRFHILLSSERNKKINI